MLRDLWDLLRGPLRPVTVLFAGVFGAITFTQGLIIALGYRDLPKDRQQLIVTIVVAVTIFVILTVQRLE